MIIFILNNTLKALGSLVYYLFHPKEYPGIDPRLGDDDWE